MAEACIMYEAFQMMKRFEVTTPGGKMKMYTDNKWLTMIINKINPTHTDLSQDAGAIVAEMIEIKKKLNFQVEVHLILKEKELVSPSQDLLQHLIQECDAKSREKRIKLELGIGVSNITPINVSI